MEEASHRPGPFKQSNKAHKTGRHRTKGQIDVDNKGRTDVKVLGHRARRSLSRSARRNQLKQQRTAKKDSTLAKKRSLGGSDGPPFLTAIISLSSCCDPNAVLRNLILADETASVTTSSASVTHLSVKRFKQRFSFLIPTREHLFDVLDTLKVCDTVIFLWPTNPEDLDRDVDYLISCIKAQGLPAPLHVVPELSSLSSKRRDDARKYLCRQLQDWSFEPKLLTCENSSDGLLILRQICSMKKRRLIGQERRPHVFVEEIEFRDITKDCNSCSLKVSGYVRGPPLSVNGLIHIAGFGDFQMSQIDSVTDPHPLVIGRHNDDEPSMEKEAKILEKADPAHQWSLQSMVEPDPMEAEQTWPTVEELEAAQDAPIKQYRKVPKGTSEYQATWILPETDADDDGIKDNDKSESGSDNEMDTDDEDPMNAHDGEESDASEENENSEADGDFQDTESIAVSETGDPSKYDQKLNKENELAELERFRKERENEQFPDEVDTPLNIPARIRFQRYRGLKSFRTSPWDPKENLPQDYARIFQFQDFRRSKKKILNEQIDGVLNGWYVAIHIKDVPANIVEYFVDPNGSGQIRHPLVLVGLMKHEQRMSTINMVITKHPSYRKTIKSKDLLWFQVGYRRFFASPVFSQHTNSTRHKFERFLPNETAVVATVYSPIIYPPAPVLVFAPEGDNSLIATGSVLDVNPDRIIAKRIVLSGHPFKINRKTTVVRYMFFNRDDIDWFKPVELRTKYGRRGHIREPLGTHGHMKCIFDGQLTSHDTVLMNLYKRIYPKWNYNITCESDKTDSEGGM